MLAHAGCLLDAGYDVHLVGYDRTSLPPNLRGVHNLRVHALRDRGAAAGGGLGAALGTALRGIRLGWGLGKSLLRDIDSPSVLVVQTPPSLPTLPIAMLAAKLRGATLVVDWHNLGWTLLALRFGPGHPLVRLNKWAEIWLSRRAAIHLSVSQALADHLAKHGAANPHVLHDGPSSVRAFQPGGVDLPNDRLVVVAPMGWTRDDDLPLLASAVELTSLRLEELEAERTLELVVSGTGPLRDEWRVKLEALGNDRVTIQARDVPSEEYPDLLASAHLGLSIHRSASGLDLPMKVVEFLAAGVPVLAMDDGSPLSEIAPPGTGVLTYRTAEELASQLTGMASAPTPPVGDLLAHLTDEARNRASTSWEERWRTTLKPLLQPEQVES